MQTRSRFFTCCIIAGVAVCTATFARPVLGNTEVAKLSPCDVLEGDDGFGSALGISGDYIVAGSPGEGGDFDGGVGCVFKREGNGWVEHTILQGEGFESGERFGFAVAIDGDYIVVGAPHVVSGNLNIGFGFAYVFRREGDTWIKEAKLVSSGSEINDAFGLSVGINGNLIVVGAPGVVGAAYIFRRNGVKWVEESRLISTDLAEFDAFGAYVSISGQLVAVAAPRNDDACPGDILCDSGSVYVFRYDGVNWVQDVKLTAPNPTAEDLFGRVSISETTLVVGVSRDDEQGLNAGAAYVYERDGGNWVQTAKLTASAPGTNDRFGAAVAVAGSEILVAAPGADFAGILDAGTVYHFERHEGAWFQVQRLGASDARPSGFFGNPIAISGDVVLSEAHRTVYVFDLGRRIPTVSQSALAVLGILLLGGAAIIIRRRQRQSDVA